MRILHIALPEDWERGRANGNYDVSTRGMSLVEVGFIHACTLAQLPGVLDRFYRNVCAVDLLVIDLARLDHEGAQVRWQEVPGTDDGPYPHIYGVIPAQTVSEVRRLQRQPDVSWPDGCLTDGCLTDGDLADIAVGP